MSDGIRPILGIFGTKRYAQATLRNRKLEGLFMERCLGLCQGFLMVTNTSVFGGQVLGKGSFGGLVNG